MIGERLQKAIAKYVVSERQHSDADAPLILQSEGKSVQQCESPKLVQRHL